MRPKQDQSPAAFWSLADRSGDCWLWKGASHSSGYGSFRFRGSQATAHRVAFQLENPAVEIGGMDICHRCDNRLCVRPDHLFVGTRQENVDDMMKKGRGPVGHKNGQAKLTPAQVAAIRLDQRIHRLIAGQYGVDQAVISRIKNGRAYVAS
jgi:hypothetical protein